MPSHSWPVQTLTPCSRRPLDSPSFRPRLPYALYRTVLLLLLTGLLDPYNTVVFAALDVFLLVFVCMPSPAGMWMYTPRCNVLAPLETLIILSVFRLFL